MRIQYLKTLLDGNVTTRKGAIVEIDDWKARELIALGYAVHIPEVEKSMAAPLVADKGEDGKAIDPFAARRPTGRDGSAKPASSSREDQARPKRTYKKREAAAK